jgi:acetyltransferase-like isoleucine patch superfamily enzyme
VTVVETVAMVVDETAAIENASLDDVEVCEYATIHDSTVGPDSRIYERTSIKKSTLGESVDVNANVYVENARVGDRVQIGPNASVVGVTHDLTEEGMEHRNDRFERVVLGDGAFVGAGAVILPGVTVGENAVVGANVTVTDDVPDGAVIRG